MAITLTPYDDPDELLVTWYYAPGDCATSTLVKPGTVDSAMTGWAYDELKKLGWGGHFIVPKRQSP